MSVKHSTTVQDNVDLVDAAKWNAEHVLTGQLSLGLMPRGTDGHVLTGTGAGTDPAYEAVEGVSNLSELTIDVNKDWNAKRITNLGVPTTTGDAYRRGSPLQLSDIPTMDDGHIPNLEGLSYGGAFAVAQIPSLPASKITSGSLAVQRYPSALLTNATREIAGALRPDGMATRDLGSVTRIFKDIWTRRIKSTGNMLELGTVTDHILSFFTNNSARWFIDGDGLKPAGTNAYDIGAEGFKVKEFHVTDIYATEIDALNLFGNPHLTAYTSKPTPDPGYAGRVIRVRSATGQKTYIYVCVQNDANDWEWVQLGVST